MIKLERTDTVVILGKRGIGKTTLARALITHNPQLSYIIIDIIGNYEDFKNKYEVLRISPVEKSKLDFALIRAMDKGKFVVMDEIDRFQYDHILSYFVNIGRNYGSGWIAIARRPANLSKDFITNANYTFIAKTTQMRDVEFIRASYDIDAEDLTSLNEHEFYLFHHDDLIKKIKIEI